MMLLEWYASFSQKAYGYESLHENNANSFCKICLKEVTVKIKFELYL